MNVIAPNNTSLVSLRSLVDLRASAKVTLFASYVEIMSVEAVKTKSTTEVSKALQKKKGFPTLFRPMEYTDGAVRQT